MFVVWSATGTVQKEEWNFFTQKAGKFCSVTLILVTLAVQRSLLLTLVSVVAVLVTVAWIAFNSALGVALQLVLVVFAVFVGVRVGECVVRAVWVEWIHLFVVLVGALVLVLRVGLLDYGSDLAAIAVALRRVVVVLVVGGWVSVVAVSVLVAAHGSTHVHLVVGSVGVVGVVACALEVSIRVHDLDAVDGGRDGEHGE